MKLLPADGPLRGRVRVPGDKSVAHRALIFGALAEGITEISGLPAGADVASTERVLRALGVAVDRDGSRARVRGGRLDPPASPLDCGNSGTTARLLLGALAGHAAPGRTARLDGDASLRRRPMGRVTGPLARMGARFEGPAERLPLAVRGGPLRGVVHEVPVASAQVRGALLIAGLAAGGRTEVRQPRGCRDHTERLFRAMGVPVEARPLPGRPGWEAVAVAGPARLRGRPLAVPGDPSSAAFLLAAAALVPGSEVTVEGVSLNPTRTGFLAVLRAMGARVEARPGGEAAEPTGTVRVRPGRLRGVDIPPEAVPGLVDELPVLAVLAAVAEGPTRIRGAAELRVKESDRLAAVADLLGALGARVVERPDGLDIAGGARLRGAALRGHGDHRVVLSAAVAALAARGASRIDDAAPAAVSFPEFFAVLDRLRRGGKP